MTSSQHRDDGLVNGFRFAFDDRFNGELQFLQALSNGGYQRDSANKIRIDGSGRGAKSNLKTGVNVAQFVHACQFQVSRISLSPGLAGTGSGAET